MIWLLHYEDPFNDTPRYYGLIIILGTSIIRKQNQRNFIPVEYIQHVLFNEIVIHPQVRHIVVNYITSSPRFRDDNARDARDPQPPVRAQRESQLGVRGQPAKPLPLQRHCQAASRGLAWTRPASECIC